MRGRQTDRGRRKRGSEHHAQIQYNASNLNSKWEHNFIADFPTTTGWGSLT